MDKIVDDIMKKYREEQRKRGLVDNWGQPLQKLDRRKVKKFVQKELENVQDNAKRTKKKAVGRISSRNPLESMSEAIGRKFKQKRESRSKSHEKTKPSESRKSTPKSEEKTKPKIPSKKERKERLGPKTNLRNPEVQGEEIDSKKRLRELVNGEYSSLKKKKDFPRRLEEAEVHQDLLKKYKGNERLKYGDIARIAKNLDANPQTVSNWLTKGDTPRLYSYMNWSTPKSEAAEKVRKLTETNNGVSGPKDVHKRLGNYYLEPEERNSRFAKREEKKMEKYFEFLKRYAEGGNHLDIAKDVGLSESGAQAYLDGATPRWVGLAGQIPSETPREGYKWLPKKYEHGGHGGRWSDWIQVPEKITDHKQVMEVVKQLKPLDNDDMRRLEKKYGFWSREENFMYLLGMTVSDSSVPSSSTSAIAMGMNLSKSYDWSKDFGDATCYYLGQIGIRAGRVKDVPASVAKIETSSGMKEIHSNEQYKWMSENSTLLRWMRRSCLGYDDSAKTYQTTESNWILRAPKNFRRSFLQGLSDGDGGVSKKGYYFSISTHSDHDTVEGLLSSFGIGTYRSRTYVRTNGFQSLKKAADTKPFRHAKSRISRMEETVRMIDARKRNVKSNPPAQDEVLFMSNERAKGKSFGTINEMLFEKYGYTLDTRTIRRLVSMGKRDEREG